MNKRLIGLMAVFALALSFASAQTVALAPAATPAAPTAVATPVAQSTNDLVNLTVGYENEYVFRGVKIAADVADASLAISLPENTDFSVISYWNTTNRTPRVGDETDFAVSQGFNLDSATQFVVGVTVYTYPKVAPLKGATTETTEPFIALKYNAFLSPTVLAAYDVNLQQVYVEGNLSQKIPVPFFKDLALVPGVAIGYDETRDLLPDSTKASARNSYYYGTGKIDLVYSPAKFFDVAVGWRTNYLNNSAVTKNDWAGASVSVKF